MDAPERIWTASTEGKCHVGFDTPSMNYTNEYIRADLMAELVERIGKSRLQLDTGAVRMSETMNYQPATILHILIELDAVMAALATVSKTHQIKEPQHG